MASRIIDPANHRNNIMEWFWQEMSYIQGKGNNMSLQIVTHEVHIRMHACIMYTLFKESNRCKDSSLNTVTYCTSIDGVKIHLKSLV